VKLPVGAREHSRARQEIPFAFLRERDVHRRRLAHFAELDHAREERVACSDRVRSGLYQQARAGDGREGDRDLKFRVIVAARAFEGVGPAVIEHVFALAVAFQVAGRRSINRAGFVFDDEILRQPAGFSSDRFRPP
jgi:hypothetical protein